MVGRWTKGNSVAGALKRVQVSVQIATGGGVSEEMTQSPRGRLGGSQEDPDSLIPTQEAGQRVGSRICGQYLLPLMKAHFPGVIPGLVG